MKILGNGSFIPLEKEGKCSKWRLLVFVEQNGKRRQRSRTVHGGKREAQAALRAFMKELEEEVQSYDTFRSYSERWLERCAESGRYSAVTLVDYKSRIKQLVSVLGDKNIGTITPEDCRTALSTLREAKNWSGTTTNEIYHQLFAVMQSAYREELIARNPLEYLTPPKLDTKERKCLAPEQLDELWEQLEKLELDHYAMAIFLMIDTGMRLGEVCSLKTKDVHDGYIVVSKSKTNAGAGRTIPLTQRLKDKCKQWHEVRDGSIRGEAETFCCNNTGGPMNHGSLHYWWSKHRDGLGVPGYTFHELRHSNISKMARFMGVHELMRWAGWRSMEMALRYVHDDLPALEAAVQRSQMKTLSPIPMQASAV